MQRHAACLLAQRRNVSPTPHQFQLIIILTISRHCRLKQTRVVHGLGQPVGLVGLSRDFAVFDGLGWVEYDKSTVFLMISPTQHTIAASYVQSEHLLRQFPCNRN